MISLSVIKVKISDKKYLMSRADLDQVRALITETKADDNKETQKRLDAVLAGKHVLNSKVKYTLELTTINLTQEVFYICSTRSSLNMRQVEHMSKVVRCAITAPNTLLVFPDYIVVSDTPPVNIVAPKKQRRGKKNGDKI